MLGIDISSWQGDIDLSPFSDHFVIIRLGYGYTSVDQYFAKNVEKCKKLGIPFGVYFFGEAIDVETAKTEAKFVVKTLEPYKNDIKVGVWYDVEDSAWKSNHGYKHNHDYISPIAFEFCKIVESAGYYTGIYCSQSWLKYLAPECDRFDKWVANWGINDGNKTTDTSALGTIQQFTSRYKNQSLDGNIMFADISRYSKVKKPYTEESDSVEKPAESDDPVESTPITNYIMTIVEWFYFVIGKGFNVDGVYGNQCWDLFAYFVIKFALGLNTYCALTKYVDDLWYLKDKYGYSKVFEYITDPKELRDGDWCIWGKGSSCPLGHVGMVYQGKILGQNQGASVVTLKSLNLDILGAFRLKGWNTGSSDDIKDATLVDLLYRTMKNEFGTGETRRLALGSRYYEVQSKIDHIYSASVSDLVSEVWKGEYGNGTVRKVILGSRYQVVQNAIDGKNNQYYYIRMDDSLWSIAQKFGTTVEQLVSWNGIKNANLIYVGQKIRVS